MFLNPPPPPKKYNLAKKCRSKKKHGSGPVSESAHGCSRHHQVAGVHVLQPIHAKSKVTSWNPTVFNVVGSGGFPRFGGKPPSLGQITRGFFVVKKNGNAEDWRSIFLEAPIWRCSVCFWCGKSRNQEEKGGKETIWKWNCWVSKQVYKANQMESSHRWWPWNPSDRTRHFKKFWKSVLSFNGSNLPTALFVFQETGSAMGLLEAPRPSFQNWPTGLQCWQKTMTTTDRQCGRQVIWLDPKQKPIQFTFLHHANSARCWLQYQI